MNDKGLTHNGQCDCGSTRFSIQGKPIVRMYCHCTICQEFNNAPYGDITVFRSKDVCLNNDESVVYTRFKSPPAVDRGTCSSCQKPAIENFNLPLMPSLTIIPSVNIKAKAYLPEPALHIFYHRRVDNIDDRLPKYSGFLKSQLALMGRLLPGLLRR